MKRSRTETTAPATQLTTVTTTSTKRARSRKTKPTRFLDSVTLGLGFPKMLKMTHKYCEQIQLTSTSGVIQNYFFKCNGMFDPNQTGTGHQPYLFDQVGSLYNHYCVIGSKAKVTFANIGTADSAFLCGVYINDDNSNSYSSIPFANEVQTGKMRQLTAVNQTPVSITQKWSAKKYFGKNPIDDPELQGTPGSDPTELSYFDIMLQANTVSNTITCAVTVEIDYIAVWKEVREVSTS